VSVKIFGKGARLFVRTKKIYTEAFLSRRVFQKRSSQGVDPVAAASTRWRGRLQHGGLLRLFQHGGAGVDLGAAVVEPV
jgi:hypothetical protein